MTPETPIASPCRKQCQLHPVEKLCLGCFRTIDEIAKWTKFGEARRAKIIEDLPARRAARAEREARLAERRR